MKILDSAQSLAVLRTVLVVRLAGFDAERGACYAVPVAFVLDHEEIIIVISAPGRLARLLKNQPDGLCLEADDIYPNLTFRSIIGTVRATPIDDAQAILPLLARRYGAEWGRWRPSDPMQAFRLGFIELQGRDST